MRRYATQASHTYVQGQNLVGQEFCLLERLEAQALPAIVIVAGAEMNLFQSWRAIFARTRERPVIVGRLVVATLRYIQAPFPAPFARFASVGGPMGPARKIPLVGQALVVDRSESEGEATEDLEPSRMLPRLE
jgi:hypothetical protein